MRHHLLLSLALMTSLVQGAEPMRVELQGFHCTGTEHSIQLPNQLPELRKLAKLQKEEVVEIEVWDGYKAIELALQFPGLSVGAITFTNDPARYTLSAARVHGNRWALTPYRVGQAARLPLKKLGVKGPTSNGAWRFEGESDAMILKVKKGRIQEVIYDCYTG
jgi:hypothetical protein